MPGEEIATLVTEASPYLAAAVSAYGVKVLEDVRDDAAAGTVALGRRLLQRVFGRKKHGDPLPGPLAQMADAPDDADALGARAWRSASSSRSTRRCCPMSARS